MQPCHSSTDKPTQPSQNISSIELIKKQLSLHNSLELSYIELVLLATNYLNIFGIKHTLDTHQLFDDILDTLKETLTTINPSHNQLTNRTTNQYTSYNLNPNIIETLISYNPNSHNHIEHNTITDILLILLYNPPDKFLTKIHNTLNNIITHHILKTRHHNPALPNNRHILDQAFINITSHSNHTHTNHTHNNTPLMITTHIKYPSKTTTLPPNHSGIIKQLINKIYPTLLNKFLSTLPITDTTDLSQIILENPTISILDFKSYSLTNSHETTLYTYNVITPTTKTHRYELFPQKPNYNSTIPPNQLSTLYNFQFKVFILEEPEQTSQPIIIPITPIEYSNLSARKLKPIVVPTQTKPSQTQPSTQQTKKSTNFEYSSKLKTILNPYFKNPHHTNLTLKLGSNLAITIVISNSNPNNFTHPETQPTQPTQPEPITITYNNLTYPIPTYNFISPSNPTTLTDYLYKL